MPAAMLPGESALQYAMRMGMAPNDASAFLASMAQSNGSASTPDAMASFIANRNTPQSPADAAKWGASMQGGAYGGQPNTYTGAGAAPVTLGPQLDPSQGWVGQTPGANTPGATLGSIFGGANGGPGSAQRIGLMPGGSGAVANRGGAPGGVLPDPGFYDPATGQGGPRNPDGSPLADGDMGLNPWGSPGNVPGGNLAGGWGAGGSSLPPSSSMYPTNVPRGTSPDLGSPGYPIDVAKYLDPSMRFQMGEGMRALESSASAGGQTLSGNTLRDILKYSQGLAGTDYGNAFNRAAQQQGFKYGVDTGDRNFAYQSQLNDQTIPFDQQMRLAQMGLTATGQQSSLAATLAALNSGNLNTLGQTGASGTIGGSNIINQTLQQILTNAIGNNTLNRILPQPAGG